MTVCEVKNYSRPHVQIKWERGGNKSYRINGFMAQSPHDAFYFTIFLAGRGIKWYIVLLLVDWRIRNMIIAFQLAVFALIATSSILLISVPVVFSSPDGWSSNKNVVFSGTSLWIGLVFLVGILNSLIS